MKSLTALLFTSDWQVLLHTRDANCLVAKPSSFGKPNIIAELENAKFEKMKLKIAKKEQIL